MIDKTATIVAYDILEGDNINTLTLRINDHLRDGWQPLGEMRHYYDAHRNLNFFQTIVRYDTQSTKRLE